MITVYYNGKPYQYADSTKYLELARTLQPQFEHDIVLASVNGKLQELWKYIKDGASVSFLTTQSQAGIMAYRRSVVLLLLKALKDTISKERLGSNQVKVEFSLSKGLFCHFDKGLVLDEEELKQVQTSMEILREANYPIEKYSISTEAAIEQFGKAKMTDKERLFRFRRASKVNIYSLDGLEDYYYGYMVPSTGYLKYFKLYSYEDGFVLQMPVREAPEVIPEFEPQHKLFKVMRETGKWGEELGVATVGELNELITGKTNKKSSCRDITDLILVQEALMEKKIGEAWADGSSFAETLTLFDVLCDSKPGAKLSGSWKAMRDFGLQFHQGLLEQDDNPDAVFFDAHPEVLTKGCLALGAAPMPGADLGYAVPAVLGVPVWVQFWHSDEEFAPRLRYLWDENALQFIRYETMWYAVGLLLERIKEEGHQ